MLSVKVEKFFFLVVTPILIFVKLPLLISLPKICLTFIKIYTKILPKGM